MKKQKEDKDKEIDKRLAEYLSMLVPNQIELGSEAIKENQSELASLMACQLFDTLDWIRLNIDKKMRGELDKTILMNVKNPALRFRNIQQIEAYAEKHFSY